MNLVLCYAKCSTCQKALKWLDEYGYNYSTRAIKEENPSKEEIIKWHNQSGLDIKKFFNTSGLIYKELKLSERLNDMSLEEKYELLASDGMLVKRPLLITDKGVCPGFKEEIWKEIL